jgi:WD40 repeat protein
MEAREYRTWEPAAEQPPEEMDGTVLALSPDGRRVAGVMRHWPGRLRDQRTMFQTVCVWDANRGRKLATTQEFTGTVTCIAFSPDGKRLAVGSWHQSLKVCDAATGQELLTLPGHMCKVYCVAFSPDGRHLAGASSDDTVRIWDASTGKTTLILEGHTSANSRVAFSPDGKRLASGSFKSVRVWELTTGRQVLSLQEDGECMAFSSDGKLLATGDRDGTVKVWKANTGVLVHTLAGHPSEILGLAFSPDSKYLSSVSGEQPFVTKCHEVRLWDLATGQELFADVDHTVCVAFSVDGLSLACLQDDHSVTRRDMAELLNQGN